MCWRSSISVLVLILTLVSTGQGCRIHLASKIPFYLLSYLSICHLRNYGVKTRKFHGRGKDPLPVSSTKRYFKPRSICLPYGTICIFVRVQIKQSWHAYKPQQICILHIFQFSCFSVPDLRVCLLICCLFWQDPGETQYPTSTTSR